MLGWFLKDSIARWQQQWPILIEDHIITFTAKYIPFEHQFKQNEDNQMEIAGVNGNAGTSDVNKCYRGG